MKKSTMIIAGFIVAVLILGFYGSMKISFVLTKDGMKEQKAFSLLGPKKFSALDDTNAQPNKKAECKMRITEELGDDTEFDITESNDGRCCYEIEKTKIKRCL